MRCTWSVWTTLWWWLCVRLMKTKWQWQIGWMGCVSEWVPMWRPCFEMSPFFLQTPFALNSLSLYGRPISLMKIGGQNQERSNTFCWTVQFILVKLNCSIHARIAWIWWIVGWQNHFKSCYIFFHLQIIVFVDL